MRSSFLAPNIETEKVVTPYCRVEIAGSRGGIRAVSGIRALLCAECRGALFSCARIRWRVSKTPCVLLRRFFGESLRSPRLDEICNYALASLK